MFVGDTVWDVKACGKAGVACVGVLSGGISAGELTEAGAVAVYDDCRALLRELDASPLAAVWSSPAPPAVAVACSAVPCRLRHYQFI